VPALPGLAAEALHVEFPAGDEIDLPDAMAALRSALYERAAAAEQPLRDSLLLAALAITDPSQRLDADRLSELPQNHRDLLAGFEVFFRRLGEEAAASGEEAAMLQLLEDLKLAIEEPPTLAIAAAHFCTRVDGFGKYETFNRTAFLSGRAQQVVIYTEIEGFTSARTDSGQWKTDLWQALAIQDSNARPGTATAPLWQQDWQPAPDVAARKRTDFFISYIITLPDSLLPGSYAMTVRIKDESTGAVAEAAIPFSIVADAKLAVTVPE
jgi:hypothetical protein